MLKPEYDTLEEVPVEARNHYALDAATKRYVLQVEQPEKPPIRYRSELASPKAKADFIKEHGHNAYLELEQSPDGQITDKAQLRTNHERREFIAKKGLAGLHPVWMTRG